MMLGADDLVSNRLVDYVLKDGDPNGYIIETDYAYDWKARSDRADSGESGRGSMAYAAVAAPAQEVLVLRAATLKCINREATT